MSRKKNNKSAGGKRQTRRQGSKQRERTEIKTKALKGKTETKLIL